VLSLFDPAIQLRASPGDKQKRYQRSGQRQQACPLGMVLGNAVLEIASFDAERLAHSRLNNPFAAHRAIEHLFIVPGSTESLLRLWWRRMPDWRRVVELVIGSVVAWIAIGAITLVAVGTLALLQRVPWAVTLAAGLVALAAVLSVLDRARGWIAASRQPGGGVIARDKESRAGADSLQAELTNAIAELDRWRPSGIAGEVKGLVIARSRGRMLGLEYDEYDLLTRWLVYMEPNRLDKPETYIHEEKREDKRLLHLRVRDQVHGWVTGLGYIERIDGESEVNKLRDVQAFVQELSAEIHEREQFKGLRPR